MAKKKSLDFKYYYEQMVTQKIAHEISPATMSRLYIIWEKSLKPFWSKVLPKEIDQQLVTEFIVWHKENRKNIQLVNVFKYLGNVFGTMVEAGALPIERRPKLELPKQEQLHHSKQKGRYITNEEFNKILNCASGWFRVFLLIAYTTGMRKMEIGKMEISRMEYLDGRWVLSLNTDNTKTGNARRVPLSRALSQLVEHQHDIRNKYLFDFDGRHVTPQKIDQKWKAAKEGAGIVGRMREHDLRHTAASNMAKDKVSPILATTLLGMSLQMYQKTYLKLTADDLIEASESSSGRIKL